MTADLASLLTHSFAKNAQQTALVSTEGSWTYATLQKHQQNYAAQLQQLGLAAHDRIGILLPKSFQFVGLISAAIANKMVYIPLDIENPANRIAYILDNAACSCLVTTVTEKERIGELLPTVSQTFEADGLLYLVFAQKSLTEPFAKDLAYVLYTSGSTGQPKGVGISDANATCFVEWAADTFAVTDQDKVASIAPFHFDLSVFDLFSSLIQGASLLLLRQDQCRNPKLIAKLLADYQITCLYATPSLLQLLLRYGKLDRYDFSALSRVLFAGEVFPINPLREIQKMWSNAHFFNLYGPTETNVVTWHPIPVEVPESQELPYPIGRLCPYAEGCLLQEETISDLKAGEEGELLISGSSVAAGYLGLAQRNQEAFLLHSGKRWYKTGDIVTVEPDEQTLTYKGRADRMIKRHGYRIELAEVEYALEKYPGIAAVVAISIVRKGTTQLVLFYQITDEVVAPSLLEWKQFSTQHLPSYMVPDQFIEIDNWPYTPSQKMNYQKLRQIASGDA